MANANKNSITCYLYANPSFFEGTARLLDFWGTLNVYNESETPEEADYTALRNDWITVGMDLRGAIEEYGRARGTIHTVKR